MTIRTDHRACLALVKGNAVLNLRLRRMADKIQGHAISVEWWPGKKMSNTKHLLVGTPSTTWGTNYELEDNAGCT